SSRIARSGVAGHAVLHPVADRVTWRTAVPPGSRARSGPRGAGRVPARWRRRPSASTHRPTRELRRQGRGRRVRPSPASNHGAITEVFSGGRSVRINCVFSPAVQSVAMDAKHVGLFDLAERRLAWATRRQSVLAQNIANANTPGYKPHDLRPFSVTNSTVQ